VLNVIIPLMQTNLLWTGIEYHSLENCLVNRVDDGVEITSTILGTYDHIIYQVDYFIRLNSSWETTYFEIESRHSNQGIRFVFESTGAGTWMANGNVLPEFEGCMDIDIPLTPLTNTLPINRLNLKPWEEAEIQVLYLDLLRQEIKPVRQKYARVSEKVYHYENVPNDFEADIIVDDMGFVVDYPTLFKRTAAVKSRYPHSIPYMQ